MINILVVEDNILQLNALKTHYREYRNRAADMSVYSFGI